MGLLPLTRRRAQLELLAHACERRAAVRVSLPPWAGEPGVVRTRFLALERDSLLLEWPPHGVGEIPVSGAAVDLYFELGPHGVGCRTATCGYGSRQCARRGEVQTWNLCVPLRVEPAQQRRHFRVSVEDLAPIAACCTRVADPSQTFAIRLRNLSAGGLLGQACRAEVGRLAAGDVLWATFGLPGEAEPCEFVVRVAHARRSRSADAVVFGCGFCPGDDPTFHRRQLERVERFVARREREQLRTRAEGVM